jgi:hypothetical protein
VRVVTTPLPLAELVTRCGYFTSETPVNNGYGCWHPDQEERRGDGPGSCYSFSCPLAAALSTHEPGDVALMRAAGYEDDEWSNDDDFMLPFVELSEGKD